jgi:hypothetical protein
MHYYISVKDEVRMLRLMINVMGMHGKRHLIAEQNRILNLKLMGI